MTQVAQRNNHVLQVLKRLKDTLDNDKKKYADKVNILVMTWERIAASAKEQRPLAAICIVEKMYKDTLNIMLQGEWPKMSPVSKTHLMQMLNRCRADLCKEMPWLNSKFRKLLELVNDPWTLPSLERILHKDPCPATPEQIIEFCESERGLLIVTRLTMLCSSRCEKVAIKLAEACFRALTGGNTVLLSLFTTNEFNFIFDIYLCLLFKYKKLECIINAVITPRRSNPIIGVISFASTTRAVSVLHEFAFALKMPAAEKACETFANPINRITPTRCYHRKKLKTVSVTDGYYLVIRLRKRNDLHEQKIWKFSHQVAAVASRYFITVSMLSRTVPNSFHLKNLISDWLSMCKENNIENEIRKIMQPAETSEHIYIMAEALTAISQQLGNQIYSSLIMELYIRALTADINYLERVKLQNDKDQMTAYEKHLASKFLALADLVKDHSGVRREFVLTAFSIHPSPENYRRVEEEAIASGKASPHSTSQESLEVGVLSEGLSSLSSEEPEGKETATEFSLNNDSQDSGAFVEISNRCPLHIPYDGIGPEGTLCFQCGDFTGKQSVQSPTHQQKKKERSLDALILIKGSTVTESLNYDVLSAPSQVLEAEKLGLSSQVCADLVTLLGSNRYHLLTWVLEWGELSSRCLRYMNEADTIKNGKKELKFLEIDYNQYKDWPENDDDEADCIEKGYEQWLEDDNESELDTDSKRSNTDDSEELMLKTAIKRSQKQMGRYAESSSDSEDSRSRPRPRKRGRPRKRLKSFSDSGSVSDSLGSDGQKQNRPSKKPRTKSKDLRKTLGRLKVLEMRENANNLSSGNDCFSSELRGNKMFELPTSATARSDPTVLKSLRAFRPNAHKTKNDEFIQSVSDNIYSSKSVSGKIVSNKNATIFDCNDNKFLSQAERFTFGGKDMELHFRTGGVRTKKYNDVIRTIKEDLISVSNIPNVANNATVNVVHVQNSNSFENSSQNVQTSTGSQSVPGTPSIVATNDNLPSVQKPKQENETQGSQTRKPNSSQSLSQNAEASFTTTAPSAAILSSALTRSNPISRPVVMPASNNQFFTTAVVRPGNKVGGQPQYMAIVNRNSLNQINAPVNQVQTTDCQNVPNSVVGFITTSNVRNFGQNFTTQASRTPIQAGTRVVAVSALDPSRFVLENERPNVILSRNYGVQNNRAGISTLYNHVTLGVNNNSNQMKRMDDSNSNSSKPNTSTRSDSSTQNVSFGNTISEVTNAPKMTIATSKPMNIQRPSNETVTFNVIPSSSVFLNTAKPNNLRFTTESETPYFNKSIMQLKNSIGTNVGNRVPSQVLSDNNSKTQTVIFQTSTTSVNKYSSPGDAAGAKRSFHLSSNPLVKIQSLKNSEGATISQNSDAKCLSTTASEIVASRSELINNVSNVSPLTLDVRNISSVLTTTTTTTTSTANGNTNYGSSNLGSSKSYNEVVNIIQGMPLHDGTTLDRSETNAVVSANRAGESGEVIAIIDSPPAVKLNSTNVLPGRNILATVLKRNSFGQVSSPMTSSIATQYSVSNARNAVEMSDHCEAVQNVTVSQSSNSSTIHYTVINPLQQEMQKDSLSSSAGDMIERIVKEEDFSTPGSIKSSIVSQIKSSEFTGETMAAGMVGSVPELKVEGQQQLIAQENKKAKTISSPLTIQGESNLPKKQVLNNQKITILVQNNEGNSDKVDNQQRNKLNELLFRDDQKTCFTFRAIKRTQSEGNPDAKEKNKKGSQDFSDDQNNDGEHLKEATVSKETDFTNQGDSGSSKPLCQYLVLEAINDPSGALPKFNQAFGKSYQIKIPQAIKPLASNETGGNEASFSLVEQEKIDTTKTTCESRVAPLHDHSQVPASESSVGENPFEIVQKPVKSVCIDKDSKPIIQKSPKTEEGSIESPNISTMQIVEGEQQQGVESHQFNAPKVARSSVVQQLLRKVPATVPPTLQAVNSINTLTSRQVKAQDVVSGSTLIYATETRAQSQIVIQRAVGRVNGPTISQVAPVIYTQNLSDQSTPQTQTLLLAAVPSGTRGVVPGAQLVRIPSSSGVWKMTPSVNPPRIVQLRPQNLVLQGGQDQSLLMQSGQPVLLHHLTSLPVKPIGVVSSDDVKTDQTPKLDVKNEVYSKPDLNMDDAKICSVPLEVDQTSTKSETSSPAAAVSEHETVSLMKDIKEFENVFEETKLKFEMEKQQGVCPQEVESISQSKTLTAVHQGAAAQADHQTVLVQPQLMLHKPQMIITSAIPNQQAIFTQKIDKPLTLEKDSEKRLILTAKPKIGVDESSQSHVAVAYVSHSAASSVNVQKPLVVVTNYAQPPASPSPSITSQNSSSPNSVVSSVSFTGTSTSSCKTPNKSKSRNIKAVPNPSKSPPVAKPQQKPQEDANTAQKIYAILEEYAVQLRNSPDMNNRPAPRRRSNPPTSTNTKRKKTVCKSKEPFLDGDDTNFVDDGTEPLAISEDSSSGVTVLQVCVSSSH